jgi:hypothetical protein
VALLSALALVSAPPAGAYLRDFQTVQSQSPLSAAPLKSVAAGCPAGKVALGTGGLALSGFPALLRFGTTGLGLQRMRLSSPPGPGTLVSAVEADFVAPPWRLTLQSQCAAVTNVPPRGPTGAPYLKDVSVVQRVSAVDSTSPKDMSVMCGGGKQSIGGGFANGLGSGVVAVRRAMRVEGGFRVQAQETDPTDRPWQMYAIAICANLTQAGQAYVTDLSTHESVTPINSSDHKADIVDCPSGQRAIGGGAELVGSNASALPPADVTLVASDPSQREGLPAGWHAAAGEEDPITGSWGIRLRAVCAKVVTPVLTADP